MARKRTLVNQMSDQMDIPKQEVSGLMAKAKKKNAAEGYQVGGAVVDPMRRYPGTGAFERPLPVPSVAPYRGYAHGGMAVIKGTPPVQVKGFYYDDNDGKGTF